MLAEVAGKAGSHGPVDSGNLPRFLHIAQRYDVALSPPQRRPAIQARAAAISTRDEARQYLEEAAAKTAAARMSR